MDGIIYCDKPNRYKDNRGFFQEVYNGSEVSRFGGLQLPIPDSMVQINHARSSHGVLRGLHWQQPNPVGKYVTCITGRILDVVVDIRKSSPTFKEWRGYDLNGAVGQTLWVPPGFAHGYVVISGEADVLYAQSGRYDSACDRVVRWNDPVFQIDWPVMTEPFRISEKDQKAPLLSEIPEFALFD